LTSSKEGWGISNLEAAACGTPSVASDAPGLRESVQHGRTGVLVPHGDVGALAEAIDGLLRDHESRERMGRQARTFAEGYTWQASSDAFETYLLRLVEEGAPD
jgi:glycosyltransferase involved in cell wall biosynthesis